jgi:lipopolysaccharide/colanic/teichoic acid biosynthesis glycosyltransferase
MNTRIALRIALDVAIHAAIIVVAAAISGWLRTNAGIGQLLDEPITTVTLVRQALLVYITVFLLLSFHDPVRTFKAVDEYQIMTVAALVSGILLGFLTLFTVRETSRLLIVYFYILHFVFVFAWRTGIRLLNGNVFHNRTQPPSPMSGYQRSMKRALDIVGSCIILAVLSPVMIVIAIAIKLDSRGSILLRQTRVGEKGKPFGMFKFRSMHADAERRLPEVLRFTKDGDIVHKHREDPRVTRVGRVIRRTSLDELPQLLNVLFGDMSLVGPRPELPMLVEKYEPWQHERFSVPQGLTGWWQVNGRSDKPMHLNTQDDLYYVRNYSLMLDLHILLKTVWVVLRGKGAY